MHMHWITFCSPGPTKKSGQRLPTTTHLLRSLRRRRRDGEKGCSAAARRHEEAEEYSRGSHFWFSPF
jgi:hypothetical protein